MKQTVILGGGASALMCACFACKKNKVLILEKAEKFGKKILATGNGRCNLTNLNMGSFAYNQNIDEYLNKFSVRQTIQFFESIGLDTYADEAGRVYPFSNSAVSVLDVLKNYLKMQKNVEFKSTSEVVDITKLEQGYNVKLADQSNIICNQAVVALGNYANLKMFKKLGIKVSQFKPSLCALKCKINKILAGVRVSDVVVQCKAVNFCETGEILFRQDGISGIVIFNLSSYLARQGLTTAEINIDFIKNVNFDELKDKLLARKNLLKNYCAEEFLTGIFHKSLNYELLKNANIKPDIKVADITFEQIKLLCQQIKNYKLNINGYLDNNQVCSGGVLLDELTPNLESKRHKGLYFIGEICDVDGVCGGYNLQWAWTSAKIVSDNLIK